MCVQHNFHFSVVGAVAIETRMCRCDIKQQVHDDQSGSVNCQHHTDSRENSVGFSTGRERTEEPFDLVMLNRTEPNREAKYI